MASAAYEPLPTSDLPTPNGYANNRPPFLWRARVATAKLLALRRVRILLGVVLGLGLLAIPFRMFFLRKKGQIGDGLQHPPLYEEYHARELSLPQHNPDLPYPEGKNGKYLYVSSHLDGYGWGNYMQEFVFDAYLAHKAGYSFVFDNYTWNRHGPEYSIYKGRVEIPSRIPLTAYLAGPIVGDAFPPGDHTPRAVRAEYFAKVCPSPAKLQGKPVTDAYVWGSTTILVEKWLEKFEETNNRCIEIEENSGEPFNGFTFGSKNVLDSWEDFANSPIMTQFRFSPLIEAGMTTNLERVHPLIGSKPANYDLVYPYTTLEGLLVLQLRRGDYVEHCYNLLNWGAQWQGYNRFPQYPDQFSPVEGSGWGGEIAPIPNATHFRRCYPEPYQIAERVKEILETDVAKGLHNVYIMTNGKADWIEEVKEALMTVKQWNSIVSSRELVANREQEYVKQVIDMLIGLRSQVIIGNGWSSMSSNVNMLRMGLLDLHPNQTRFW